MVNYLSELDQWLKENDILRDDIIIVGSASMADRGIRQNHDIEFTVRPKKYNCVPSIPGGYYREYCNKS